jgi:hypothetical protein
VPSILAGTCWSEQRVPIAEEYPRNLFTHVAGGRHVESLETVTRLCPPSLCEEERPPFRERFPPLLRDAGIAFAHYLLPATWRTSLPPIDHAWGDFAAAAHSPGRPERERRDVEVERFEAAIARVGDSARPPLLVAHLALPHRPFEYLPTGRKYRTQRREPDYVGVRGLHQSYQRHLLQLGYVDTLLGRLLDRLDRVGFTDRALIVVTADHGVSFREGEPPRDLTEGNAVDILSVPLLIKRPGQRAGEIRDERVQTVDILPTISEILELPPPEWVDGRSLLAPFAEPSSPSCPRVREEPAPNVDLSEILAAADAKIELFGSGSTAGTFPALGPRGDLLGRTVVGAECTAGAGLDYDLERRPLFEAVDLASGFVPAQIDGLVKGFRAVSGVDLAIAVNGSVVATTRSFELGAGDVFPWSAIAPESSFADGANTVELFAVRPPGSDCALEPLSRVDGEWSQSFLGVRMGAWPIPQVEESGFSGSLEHEGDTLRGASRRSELRVPLSAADARRVRRLRLELEALDRQGVELKVLINGKRVIVERLDAGAWSREVALEPEAGELTVTLRAVGLSSKRRQGSIAVRGIWLLPG